MARTKFKLWQGGRSGSDSRGVSKEPREVSRFASGTAIEALLRARLFTPASNRSAGSYEFAALFGLQLGDLLLRAGDRCRVGMGLNCQFESDCLARHKERTRPCRSSNERRLGKFTPGSKPVTKPSSRAGASSTA